MKKYKNKDMGSVFLRTVLSILMGVTLLALNPTNAHSATNHSNTNKECMNFNNLPKSVQDIKDKKNVVILCLKDNGIVAIKLLPSVAPKHVKRIETLTQKGFYNGLIFHRVIPGFMAQTGDPTGTGLHGSTLPDLAAEFSHENFSRGTVGMARAASLDSANSQFFIVTHNSSFLDGKYTLFGRVISGIDAVDNIAPGEPPIHPDKIIKMVMLADVPHGQGG